MLSALRLLCEEEGFDLVEPVHTRWYNDLIEEEGHVERGTLKKLPVPPTISEAETKQHRPNLDTSYNAVLIGNSKAVWPKFIEWLSSQCQKEADNDKDGKGRGEIIQRVLNDNPFDTFVADNLFKVFQSCCNNKETANIGSSTLTSYDIFWSNGKRQKVEVDATSAETAREKAKIDGNYHCYAAGGDEGVDESFLVSTQRVAKVTGKFWHDEAGTKLCVHPQLGTWTSFRALVVFHTVPVDSDQHVPVPELPAMCPCPVTTEDITMAKEVMDYAIKASVGESNIDYGMKSDDHPSKNLCKYLHATVTSGSDWSKVSPTMRPWIQLRDCISVGREKHKYEDAQLLYHYTKDPEILKNELRKL